MTHTEPHCVQDIVTSAMYKEFVLLYKVVYSKERRKSGARQACNENKVSLPALKSLFLAGDCDDISVLCLESEDDVRLVVLVKLLLPKECIWAFSHELHIQLVDIKNHHYNSDALAGGNFATNALSEIWLAKVVV